MWIQVRTMDGRKSVQIEGLSKLTKIEELRERLVDPFDADPSRQRLFYRGKQVLPTPPKCVYLSVCLFVCFQLEDGNSLFDYDVGLNDIIQLMVRPLPKNSASPTPAQIPVSNAAITNGTSHAQNGDTPTQHENGIAENGNGVEGGDGESVDDVIIGVYKVRASLYTYMCLHTCVYVHVSTYMCLHTCVCVHVCLRTCVIISGRG